MSGVGLEEKQVSVSKAYEFRAGKIGVIKNYDIIQRYGKNKVFFYVEHIEERKEEYYSIWVSYYTEEDVGGIKYNKIYHLQYDNKPAVIFAGIKTILNPPIEEGDVFTIGLGIINQRPSFVVKVVKKHGTFAPHIQKETKVYK